MKHDRIENRETDDGGGGQSNAKLQRARKAKNDEFYTLYEDIEREIGAYLDYDPDTFRGKTVLCPCDDPEWSNFTKYFAQNFERLGLKKLISTSYACRGGKPDPTGRGRILMIDGDANGDGRIDINDIRWEYLEGTGDFRSPEVCALRDECDIIVTNPPFSLFREFIPWIFAGEKKFIVIGNMNAVTCKDTFRLIQNEKMWLGNGFLKGNSYFETPDGNIVGSRQSWWFTNLEHGRRHTPLQLMTMADNIKYSRHKEIRGIGYQKYDNCDAIDVPFCDAIPLDYNGKMGVPVTFISSLCPEQFEILGLMSCGPNDTEGIPNELPFLNGKFIYRRLIIRHKNPQAASQE